MMEACLGIVAMAGRLAGAILGWLAASAALGLLAHGIACRLAPEPRRLTVLHWVFWWYFLVTLTVWATGVLGLLRPLWILVVLLLFAGVRLRWEPFVARRTWDDIAWAVRSLNLGLRRRPLAASVILLVWLLMGVRQVAHVWVLPPVVYDVLSYHLPKVADWIGEGRLVALPTPVVRSFWPANFELFQTWFVLFWKQDAIIEAAGLFCYALATASAYTMARSLGAGRTMAAIAATGYATSPAVLLNAVGANNDIAVAGCFLFIVAVLLESRHRVLALAGLVSTVFCAACVGIGTKPYLAFMLPALVLLVPICWPAWRRRDLLGRSLPDWVLAGLALAGVALGSYWYVRNVFLFSNPVYPADLRLFGKLLAGDGHGAMWQQGTFSGQSLAKTVISIFTRRICDNEGPYTPDLINMTGWGWFAVCAGLPAILIQAVRRRRCMWVLAAFALAGALVLACVASDPWNMRYLQWAPAVFVLGWALLVEDLRDPVIRGAAMCFGVMCLFMNVVATMSNGVVSPNDWRHFRRMPVGERAARSCFDGISRAVPAGATVAHFLGPNDPVYVLHASDMNRRVRWLRIAKPGDSFHEAMLKSGYTYLAIDANQTADRDWLDPFRRELREGLFRHLGGQCYEVVR